MHISETYTQKSTFCMSRHILEKGSQLDFILNSINLTKQKKKRKIKPIIVHRLSKQSKCTWTNRNLQNRVIHRSSSLKLKPNILNIWISSKGPHQQQGMFIHFNKRGSLVFNQLHGCRVGRSNQDLLTASLSPAAFWRRCTHFLTPCAPAMQQSYELKNERRGGAWERGREGWGGGQRRGWMKGERKDKLKSLSKISAVTTIKLLRPIHLLLICHISHTSWSLRLTSWNAAF